MTELTAYRPPDAAGQLVAWADALQAASTIADVVTRTNACPPAFRGKPHEATAVIVLGAELGLSPIAALRSMFEIRGQLGMYVRAQVALVQSRGHRIWTVSETDDEVVVAGHRAGDPEHVEEVAWSIARARRAGFIRRGQRGEPSQYELQPRAMLWARAAGDVARRIAADALQGVPELDDPGDPGLPASAPAPSGRVLQRQPRTIEDVELPSRVTVELQHEPPVEESSPPPQESPRGDDEPEVTLPVEGTLDDVEPTITRPQMNRMQALFIRAGARSPEQRHAYLTRWLDRPVEHSQDITVTEASSIIDRLQAQVGDA
jgi:hypothetical protein